MKKLLLCSGILFCTFALNAQNCSDLFFSKYVSMGSNNKCLEIYNPTASSIVLDGKYYLARYKTPTTSGQVSGPIPSFPSFSDTVWLKGTVAAYSTWVVCNPETTPSAANNNAICDPALQAHANQLGNIYGTYGAGIGDPTYFKGADAITIEKKSGANYVIVDLFGRFTDYMASTTGTPSAWSTIAPYTGGQGMGTWITKGYMMVRKPTVLTGVTANPSGFDPMAEYDTIAKPVVYQDTINTWNKLGSHTCNCAPAAIQSAIPNPSETKIYPNPVSENSVTTIVCEDVISGISLYGMSGKLIFEKSGFSPETSGLKKYEINSGGLAKGIYVVKITHPNGKQEVRKFTKQ